MQIFFLFFFILFHPLTLSWAQEVQDNSCVACHSDYWEVMKESLHAQNGISCQNCHGGDASQDDPALAMSPEAGFIGVPDKAKTAQVCGACHADVEFMNFYGIQTDQFARYKTSVHGKRLFEAGDNRVAVCSDCHGYHDVAAVGDPSSPVYPLNLPKTCNRCHGDEKLMSHYNLPTDILKTYQNSVHGKALFEKNDISVAQCASCHGSHGAVPPGVKEVGATCGKCHVNEKKHFLESVHAQLPSDKFSECVSCHGFHGVEHPTADLYGKACLQCHDQESKAFRAGQEIARMIKESERSLDSAQDRVKQAAIEGIFVDEETAALEEVKTHVIEMAPAQHSLLAAKISELNSKVLKVTEEVEEGVSQKRQGLKIRKLALIPLWIFIFVMVGAFWTKYKQLKPGFCNKK